GADPLLVQAWRSKLGDHGFKVGIVWQGDNRPSHDIGRSFPVTVFAPLTSIPGLRLISLQKYAGAEQLRPSGLPIEELWDDQTGNFDDTAAVMENLDLVITSDPSTAHLAAALGRPTWIALRYLPDWRWLLDRSDSPWYPTVRLFRQPRPDDWGSVFTAVAAEL